MAVMLLYERDIVGRASHLNNYITDLEAIDIDTPVEWSEVELQELQYPYFQEEVGKQRQTWATLYKTVATATQGRIQQKDLFWAMQAVRSRAFSGPFSGASSLIDVRRPCWLIPLECQANCRWLVGGSPDLILQFEHGYDLPYPAGLYT